MPTIKTLPVVSTGAGQLQALVPIPAVGGGHAGGPPIPIAAADVILSSFTVVVGDNAVIQFSTTLHVTGGVPTTTLKLFRDGVEIDATDEYVQTILSDFAAVTVHWVDAPAAGPHTYAVKAIAAGGTAESLNRRTTIVS